MGSKKTLKEIAVSSISTDEDVSDTTHDVDYRVGICLFSINKYNIGDTLLPHGVAEVI